MSTLRFMAITCSAVLFAAVPVRQLHARAALVQAAQDTGLIEPALLNEADVAIANTTLYPHALENAGIGGTVLVYFDVTHDGAPDNVGIARTSRNAQLDSAGLGVVRASRWRAAREAGKIVAMSSKMLVQFGSGVAPSQTPANNPPVTTQQPGEYRYGWKYQLLPPNTLDGGAPAFTPYTVAPELKNREEVGLLLMSEYPEHLRASGIGGRTLLWALVDARGVVTETRLKQSSGFDDLNAAAMRVAAQMVFTPALNRDHAVAIWIQLPLVFRPEVIPTPSPHRS